MLTYWNPHRYDRTTTLFDDLARSFDRIPGFADLSEMTGRTTHTRMNVYESDEAYALVADLPGMRIDDVNVSVKDGTLSIAAERTDDALDGYAALRRERGKLAFERSFTLPDRVDVQNTEARLDNGVLTVTLPKHPDTQPRRIEIKTG